MLHLAHRSTGALSECEVEHHRAGDEFTIRLTMADGRRLDVRSALDFEEALDRLRTLLEEQDLLLLCNRYRMDAFVTSMSRQMSDGLGCYIIRWRRPIDPSQVVSSLDPAPLEMVTSKADAAAFIATWIDGFGRFRAARRWLRRRFR